MAACAGRRRLRPSSGRCLRRRHTRLRRLCAEPVPEVRKAAETARSAARARRLAPAVRALVVTNMYPTPERPALGSFVRDQVEALRRRGDVEVELFAFPPGPRNYPRRGARAAAALRRRARSTSCTRTSGSTAWPALLAAARPARGDAARQRPACTRARDRATRARAPVHGAARGRLARVQRERARRRAATRRVAMLPGRRRPHALPADPARRGARAARARPRRPLPAVPARPRAAAQALRPRARGGRRRAGCSRWAACRPRRCRTGSTRPTRSSCRRRTRASGSR